MNFLRIWTVIDKEWALMFHRSTVLIKFLVGPLLIMPVFIWLLSTIIKNSGSNASALLDVTVTAMLALFPIVPLGISTGISAGGIASEKISRNLEPLLASPLTTAELLLAKMAAAIVPALVEIWICYGVLVVGTRHIPALSGLLLNGTWLMALLVVTPLVTILGESVVLMITAQCSEVGKAQKIGAQIASAISLVFAGGILYARYKLKWDIDSSLMLKIALALILFNAVAFFLAILMFRRETIISNWQ